MLIDVHSKGSLTVGSGLQDVEKYSIHSIANKIEFYLLGLPYHIQSIANTLYVVSDHKKDHVNLQNHVLDPLDMVLGHNPLTFPQVSLEINPY